MKQPRLVVVGNGMAGVRTLEELLKLVPGMYDITVFGAEPHPNYNRILLSPVLAGSVMRPLGGVIADRIGGTRTLQMVYSAVTMLVAVAALGVGGAALTVSLFVLTLLCLGAGNGAVFQLVPQRFGAEIGLMTGLIGMAGGVGGFLLAAGLGVVKQHAGSYAPGLWLFAGIALAASLCLVGVKQRWRLNWAAGTARV